MNYRDLVSAHFRTFRRDPWGLLRMQYTFNRRRPPDDVERRRLWVIVGEGEYQTERNTAWILTYFVTPLFGLLTVVVFVVAVVRGGAEWEVLGIVAAMFVGCLLLGRSWRRSAMDLRSRLDQESGRKACAPSDRSKERA